MKKTRKFWGIIVMVAIIGLAFAACVGDSDDDGVYKIGDTGPGSGKVFYDKGKISDGWRYLEAAPSKLDRDYAWSTKNTSTDITGTAIGTGKANTDAILAIDPDAPAAKACVDYRGGNKDDWFLPSKDELAELYKQRNHFGITFGHFWSSSQYDASTVWSQSFATGGQTDDTIMRTDDTSIGTVNHVHPIRSF